MKAKWSVLAVYKDGIARQTAVEFCDKLVQRFWSKFSFDLNWCEWASLENDLAANSVDRKAREADLIIFVTGDFGKIPLYLENWLEQALHGRADREGILVGLPKPETGLSVEVATTQLYLRKLAHASGMDYLTDVPESLAAFVPDLSEASYHRATQVTSVLDTILSRSPPPRTL
jgi:hypothetical protein